MSDKSKGECLVVCDLDNTLYDWVSFFVPSFEAMVDKASILLNVPRETLLDELREVHQRYKDSEHPYALLETRSVQDLLSRTKDPDAIFNKLDPAFHAFNSTRKQLLQLYPGVKKALSDLNEMGCLLVAHTESKYFAAVDRLQRLDVIQYFSHVYCRERSQPRQLFPHRPEAASRFALSERVTELTNHQSKPDPGVLIEICVRESFPTAAAVYIGDSMARDMLMAKRAGVLAVWAKYGSNHNRSLYDKLVRVTHWSSDDIDRENAHRAVASRFRPDEICEQGFFELVPVVERFLARGFRRPAAG